MVMTSWLYSPDKLNKRNTMEFSGFQTHNIIEEVEKCTKQLKQQLEIEKREIENSEERVKNLLNSFFPKESDGDSEYIEPMRISLPNKSIFDTIFKEDTQDAFLFSEDREEKRKRLAAERRAEYNAYLERKEQELFKKRKVHEEMSTTTTPRSVLESVDYQTVLAKRKEEESKFRQINYAEPSLSESVKHDIPSQQKLDMSEKILSDPRSVRLQSYGDLHLQEKRVMTPRTVSKPQSSSSQDRHIHRTGGGGEPVRDSFGNLITARGYKDTTAPILLLPSFKQDSNSNKKFSYREELERQIEEKQRLAALEKQKEQELEDRIAQRIEEQRRQMLLEYEKERKANDNLNEQRQQDRLRKLEEFQRQDANRKQKFKENKVAESKQINESAAESRSSSPPVPSVRSKVISEKAVSPVPSATRPLIEAPVKPENIFSSIAEIRRKIMQDQQNFNREVKGSYEVMNRRTVPDVLADDEDDYDIPVISERLQSLKT